MKILFVTYAYAPFLEMGGPPVKIRALATGLVTLGHEVTVLTADHDRARGGHTDRLEGVDVRYLPILTKYRSVPMTRGVRAFARWELGDFDAVQVFGLYDTAGPIIARASRRRGIPYLVEPMGMAKPIVRSRLKKRAFHALLGAPLLGHASAVIATAPQEREELVEMGVASDRVVVRRNGIDLAPFRELPQRGSFRRSLGISDREVLVLFFGRISQKKRPEALVRAFAAAGDGGRLVFAGPDEDGLAPDLRRIADDLGVGDRVEFTGPVFEEAAKVQLLTDADLFVLPSVNENFGNSIVEAMAARTAVVITESCGVAPLVRGRAGVVVADDLGDLPATLGSLIRDGQRRAIFASEGVEVVQGLTWEEPVRQQETVLRSAIEEARSRSR